MAGRAEGALGGVLRVLAARREEGLRELALDVEDACGALQEELYSRGEVVALFSGVWHQLERTARRELEHCAHSAGVAVRLLAEEVQRSLGAELELVDVHHRLEEPGLLQEVRALEERALALPAGNFAALGNPAGPRGGEGGGGDSELGALREEVGRLQAQLLLAREEGAELGLLREEQARLERELLSHDEAEGEARRNLARAEAVAATLRENLSTAQLELDEERGRRDRAEAKADELAERPLRTSPSERGGEEAKLRKRVAELEAEVGAKLAGSKQFQQLRKMLGSKSQDVVRLRQRLRAYEPEEVPDGDA